MVRQQNRFLALMNNYNRSLDIQNQLTNSAGTLQMQYAEYMNSVEASANRAKVAFEGMFIDELDSDSIKYFYDLVAVLTQVIDGIGLLNIIIFILTTAFVTSNSVIKTFIKGAINMSGSISALATNFISARSEMGVFQSGLFALGVTIDTVKVKAFLLQATLTLGLSLAITFLIKGFMALTSSISNAIEEQEKFIENQKKTYNQNKQNISQLEALTTQYSKATKGTEEYNDIQNQIVDLMPEVIKYYDEEGKAVYATASEVRELVKEQKRLNAERAKTISMSVTIDMEDDFKELSKIQNKIKDAQAEFNNRRAKSESLSLIDSFLSDEDIKKLDKNGEEYKQKTKQLFEDVQKTFISMGGNLESTEGVMASFQSAFNNDEFRKQLQEQTKLSLNESKSLLDGYSASISEVMAEYTDSIKQNNVYLQDELGISDQNIMMLMDKYVDSFVEKNDITKENFGAMSSQVKEEIENIAKVLNGQDIDLSDLFDVSSTQELNSKLNDLKDKLKDTDMESGNLEEILAILESQIKDNIDTTNKYTGEQIDLTKAMEQTGSEISDTIDGIEKAQSILEKLNSDGMSLDIIQDISNNYPELLNYLGDEAKLRGELKNKIDDQYDSLNSLANVQYVNKDAMDTLIKMYPELKNQVTSTANGYKIERDVLNNVVKAKVQAAIKAIQAQRLETGQTVAEINKRITAIAAEHSALGVAGSPLTTKSGNYRQLSSSVAGYNKQLSSLYSLLGNITSAGNVSIPKSYSSGSGSSGSSGSNTSTNDAFNEWMNNLGRNSELAEHQLEMNKLNQQYEQGIGNSNEFIELKIQEGMIYKDLNNIYQSNINKIKAKMKTVSKSSDEYHDLENALNDYTQSMRQNEIAILDNKSALEDYNKTLRDGVISAQELVLDSVKSRVKLEHEANKQILDDKISFLNKEKQLLRDEYNSRQQEKEEEDRQERLSELQGRYNRLSLDNSGMYEKEKLDLKGQIDSLENEIYESSLEKEIERQEASLDGQIAKYEKEQTVLEEHFNKLEEDMQSYWNEVDNIMQGSQNSIINYLKENSEEYRRAGELQKEAYLEGWGETIGFAKDVINGDLKTSDQIAKTTPRPETSPTPPVPTSSGGGDSGSSKSNPYGTTSSISKVLKKGASGNDVKSLQWALQQMGYSMGGYGVDGKFGSYTDSAVRKFQKDMGISVDGSVGSQTKGKFKTKGYSKGGLVDYTGTAIVHGSEDEPEAFLNANQTGLFQKLTSLLEKSPLSISSGSSFSKLGNIDKNMIINSTFGDININVEKLESDADYDEIGTKVKDNIYNTIKGLGLQLSIPKVR